MFQTSKLNQQSRHHSLGGVTDSILKTLPPTGTWSLPQAFKPKQEIVTRWRQTSAKVEVNLNPVDLGFLGQAILGDFFFF